jgi:hypothetical protein
MLIEPFDKIGLQRFIISQSLFATLFIMAVVTNLMVPPILEHLVGVGT